MGFSGLIGFLSRLPGKKEGPEELAKSTYLIPLAGLVIGVVLAIIASIEYGFLPRWFAVLAFILSFFAVKGILHIDGLSDLADASASNAALEKRIEILKDPHIGTAGAIAVALVLVALVLTLLTLPFDANSLALLYRAHQAFLRHVPTGVFISILVAELNATASMVIVLAVGRPYSASVLARPFFENANLSTAIGGFLFSGTITFLLGGTLVLVTLASVIVAVLVTRFSTAKIGGVGGDALGASYTICFVSALALAALVPWAAPF